MPRYIDNAYNAEIFFNNPKWEPIARNYEKKLAANLYKTPIVQKAAKTALTRLSTTLNAYYYGAKQMEIKPQDAAKAKGAEEAATVAGLITGENIAPTRVLVEALLANGNKRNSAGQVGEETYEAAATAMAAGQGMTVEQYEAAQAENMKTLDAVMNQDGSVREQMTMLYNGIFINGGFDEYEIGRSHSLKNLLANITPEDVERMNAINPDGPQFDLDFGLINSFTAREEKGDFFNTTDITMHMRKYDQAKKKKGFALTRNISTLFRAAKEGIAYKLFRTQYEKPKEGNGEAYYDELGLGLSEREKKYGMKDGKLQWKEGASWGRYHKDVTSGGKLQVMGTSGTTIRMMAGLKLLGASNAELLDFRLALISWMVPAQDHSIYEIMRASHVIGVIGNEKLDNAIDMYKTLDPLSEEDVRRYSPKGELPHETLFLQMVQDIHEERSRAAIEKADAKNQSIVGNEALMEQKVTEKAEKEMIRIDGNSRLSAKEKAAKKEELRQKFDQIKAKIPRAKEIYEKYKANIDRIHQQNKELQGIMDELVSTYGTEAKSVIDEVTQEEVDAKKAAYESDKTLENKEAYELYKLAFSYQQAKAAIDGKDLHIASYFAKENAKDLVEILNLDSIGTIESTRRMDTLSRLDSSKSVTDLEASDVAMNIYTTDAYKTMTVSSILTTGIGNMYLKRHYLGDINGAQVEDLDIPGLIDKTASVVRLAARISQEKFQREGGFFNSTIKAGVPPQYVYRGTRYSSSYKNGFTTDQLTSTSKDAHTSGNFYHSAEKLFFNFSKKAIMLIMKLNGKSGIDIEKISKSLNEKEVLLPVGVKFNSTSDEFWTPLDNTVIDVNRKITEEEAKRMKAQGKDVVRAMTFEEVESTTSKALEKKRQIKQGREAARADARLKFMKRVTANA